MTPQKIPKAGQSKHPLHTRTVTIKGKTYNYRGLKVCFWLNEDELKDVEEVFNYIKKTEFVDFTPKERKTIQSLAKAVILGWCEFIRERYIDEKDAT